MFFNLCRAPSLQAPAHLTLCALALGPSDVRHMCLIALKLELTRRPLSWNMTSGDDVPRPLRFSSASRRMTGTGGSGSAPGGSSRCRSTAYSIESD